MLEHHGFGSFHQEGAARFGLLDFLEPGQSEVALLTFWSLKGAAASKTP